MTNFDNLTTISRKETIDGLSIPGIIRNGSYYFTDIQVYSDGLIYCWDTVDLELFQQKLDKQWVVTSIPDGQYIHIHSLGQWKIEQGQWEFTPQTYYEFVHALVRQLNPAMENLKSCYGSTTIKKGNVNYAKFPIPNPKPYYISEPSAYSPKRASGDSFNIFFREDNEQLYLAQLSIYPDGHLSITHLPQTRSYTFPELAKLMEQQRILTELPPGVRVHIWGLGSFVATEGDGEPATEKLKEFTNSFMVMNGAEDLVDKCRRILEDYRKNPTEQLKESLKQAYEAIPEHERMYVGDMDVKDIEVRMIIYGEDEIRGWSHYQVAKNRGEQLPGISIPKPKSEQ
ncbi:hypothetical protein CLV59_104148 [Chitinophaga dinghuensis]|uniref:Uncharacterized protein n=1 Tax=Chitinophaga dinghuensis TaxID=1539050 RepID=A0A327VZX3_9BACT|nr:hypothetical protein [Chitinophaga dinghuensis]RAJ81923.1 hypothetical protein CLV59_104148 [Chitinophaga dinghuensis]